MEKSDILKGVSVIGNIASELTYGVVHLRQSFEQKRKANVEEAQDFLSYLAENLPEKNPYFAEGEKPSIIRPIESGFHNACFKFESSKGKWVMKIGHKKSPMKTKFDPSMQGYAESYLRNLRIQRLIFGEKLPNLIPEPQEVLYVKGQERATTIVVQPFIDYVSPFDKKINFSLKECRQLRGELDVFQDLVGKMRSNYGIMPDFMRARGKKGHLVVARRNDGLHLVMLDNGAYDEKGDSTPLLHFLNKIIAKKSIEKQKKKLEI